jgi:hypothetical protein
VLKAQPNYCKAIIGIICPQNPMKQFLLIYSPLLDQIRFGTPAHWNAASKLTSLKIRNLTVWIVKIFPQVNFLSLSHELFLPFIPCDKSSHLIRNQLITCVIDILNIHWCLTISRHVNLPEFCTSIDIDYWEPRIMLPTCVTKTFSAVNVSIYYLVLTAS